MQVSRQLLINVFMSFQLGGNPFGGPSMDALAAFGFPGANMNPQVGSDAHWKITPQVFIWSN